MRSRIILLLTFVTFVTGFSQIKRSVRMPTVQTIDEGVVTRVSDNKDEYGRTKPPWKQVKITNVFDFKTKPVVGEHVTIVPLDVDIAPLDLKIVKTEKLNNACDEKLPSTWHVELESISQSQFFEIAPGPERAEEYPFDVCVVYPAVKFADQLRGERLSKAMLPKGVALNTIKGAIDLTSDGKPDLLIVKYCCGDWRKPARQCDYACGKTFKKIRNVWKLIDTSAPC